MNIRGMCLFLIGPFILMLQLPSGAAEPSSDLTCNVTRQPDGSFFYQLSRSPSSSSCTTGWESENRTAITYGSKLDTNLVQNLTAEGLYLRVCREYLHYTEDCDTFDEAHCRVNCSLSLPTSPPTVNSTMTCLVPSWCPNPLKFWLCIAVISVLVVVTFVAVGFCLWKYISKLRRGSSYTAANYQMKDTEMVPQVIIV